MLPALGHALAGAIASALAKTLVYPIEIVVTRMQVQKQLKGEKEAASAASAADAEYTSLLDAARKFNLSDDDTLGPPVGLPRSSHPTLSCFPHLPAAGPPGWPHTAARDVSDGDHAPASAAATGSSPCSSG